MRKSLLTIIICLISAMLLAGCSAASDNSLADKPETAGEDAKIAEDSEEETEDSDDESDKKAHEKKTKKKASKKEEEIEESAALTKSECEDEVEKLMNAEPVTPDNSELLLEMANCVTSLWIEDSGVIFSEMDNDYKESLRMRFFDLIFYGGTELSKATADDFDPSSGVPLEDAAQIFKEAYGENDFTPGEYEDVKDGRLFPTFGAGDAIHVIEHMQIFEDEDYYLLSGPIISISDAEGDLFEGYGDILFAKNPASRYKVTLLYGRYRNESVNISSVETSSTLPASKDKSYEAANLIDKDYTTVWVEGASGDGIGETITIHLGKEQPVYGVQIISGYTASYKQYSENGIPTSFTADFGNGAVAKGSLDEYYIGEQDSSEELANCSRSRIELDKPAITDTITITITGVKPGAKYDDTCASEVWVY
ncbi:MAG: discoidin domain-containing protein [Lachnospiraceae bacterium]|nr:discoidin domain-containing protein [Lachnospiraceae bacterium]